jgi:hypothetical protein
MKLIKKRTFCPRGNMRPVRNKDNIVHVVCSENCTKYTNTSRR